MAYRSQARNKRTGEVVLRAMPKKHQSELGRPQTYAEALAAAETIADKQNWKDSRTNDDWIAEAIEWDPQDPNNLQNSGRPGYNSGTAGHKQPRATFTWK
jgi:hypothetical protein